MKQLKLTLLVLPAVLLCGLLLLGLTNGFLQSLGYFPSLGLDGFSWDYYQSVLADADFWSSLAYSTWLALSSALISIVVGVGLSYIIVLLRKTDCFLWRLPVAIPHVVIAFMVTSLISQTGFISRLAGQAGLANTPNDFPLLIQDPQGIGILIAYVLKQVPYVLSVIALVMKGYHEQYSAAARTLGATSKQTFFHVTLPLTLPSISTVFVILFCYDLGAYEIPRFLGATLPEALSIRAHKEFFKPDLLNRPRAMAFALLLVFANFILVALYLWAFDALYQKLSVKKDSQKLHAKVEGSHD